MIGLINTENAPVGSFPELREGALAAVHYINVELDGVAGRPLQIAACATSGTPESSQGCANQLVGRRPLAVIGGVDLGADASLPVLEKAGIPYVSGAPASAGALTSSTAFMLNGGLAAEILGEMSYAVDTLHARRVAAVYTDVPGLVSQATTLLGAILQKKGVDFRTIPVAAEAPDLTPALATAQSSKADIVLMAFSAQSCARAMLSAASIGLQARLFYPSICAEQRVISAAGSAAEGGYFAAPYVPYTETGDPQVATYLDALKAYNRALAPSLLSQAGFSVVMDLRALLSEIGSQTPTPAALTSRLQSARDHPSFMGHPFTCDRKQVPELIAVCSMNVQLFQVRNGTFHPIGGWVDGTPLIRLLTG